MKKKILLFSVIALMMVVFVSAQSAPDAVSLKVTLVNQEPDPVDPGSYVDVRFKVENFGTKNAENVEFEVLPEYPFTLRQGDSALQNLNTIGGMQTGEEGVMVKYKLKVDEASIQGDNDLKVRYRVNKGPWVELSAFKIVVRSSSPVIDIASVTSTPSVIVPGESSTVTFTLRNSEDGLLKDVTVSLDLTGTAIPLVPVGSTAEKKIKFIEGKTSADVSMEISALSNAEAGIYKVPITITYNDASGTLFTRTGVVGLTVGSKPDIVVLVDSSKVSRVGTSGIVNVKFTNKGLSEIKFLNVVMKETEQIRIGSSPEVYIGKIDSDDYETAEFNLYVSKADDGKVMLPIDLEYRDANNKLFTEHREVELRIFNPEEAEKFGINGGANPVGPLIVVLIVAAGLGIYFWRRHKNKKK